MEEALDLSFGRLLMMMMVQLEEGKRPLGRPDCRWENNNSVGVNPLNAQLNPICHLLALFGADHILHVSR